MLRLLQRSATPLFTSGGVVAEVWRDGAKQPDLARSLRGVDIRPIDAAPGRTVGELSRKLERVTSATRALLRSPATGTASSRAIPTISVSFSVAAACRSKSSASEDGLDTDYSVVSAAQRRLGTMSKVAQSPRSSCSVWDADDPSNIVSTSLSGLAPSSTSRALPGPSPSPRHTATGP